MIHDAIRNAGLTILLSGALTGACSGTAVHPTPSPRPAISPFSQHDRCIATALADGVSTDVCEAFTPGITQDQWDKENKAHGWTPLDNDEADCEDAWDWDDSVTVCWDGGVLTDTDDYGSED